MSRILLTGVSGQLGTVVSQTLHKAGRAFRATDRVRPATPMADFHRADLLSTSACRRLVQRVDTLVHLGNISTENFPPRQCLDENVIMNRQLFQAAAEAGVRRIIFASSLQIIALPPGQLPSLPIDETTPASPQNFYSLSKQCSEQALALFCRDYGITGVALRLPTLVYAPHDKGLAPWLKPRPSQGFGYLTYQDAADLILTLLDADLPGYRHYVPASSHNALHLPAEKVLQQFYPGQPLRKELTGHGALFDLSTLVRETSWVPQDKPLPTPPVPLTWRRRWQSVHRPWLFRLARGMQRRMRQ